MEFFKKKQMPVYAVVDAGGSAIKAAIFEMAAGGGASPAPVPRILEKFVWDLPASYPPVRLVKKIRESVLGMAGKTGRMPQRIMIALGPEVGEYALQTWAVASAGAPMSDVYIREQYERLFSAHADTRRAMIVSPIETLVNDDPWAEDGQVSGRRLRAVKEYPDEVQFRILALYMSLENGALFGDLKNNFLGISVSFVPLVIAEWEAVVREMGQRDAFLIDVGAEATALVSIRTGRIAHTAFVPCGIQRMAVIAAKKYRFSVRNARIMMRNYAQGNLSGEALVAASAAAAEAATEWKLRFVRALDTFYPTGPLSPTVLLMGGGARFPEIRAAVEAPDWLGGFSHTEKPAARVLDGAAFFNGNTLGGHLSGTEDAGIAALIAHCIHKSVHKKLSF